MGAGPDAAGPGLDGGGEGAMVEGFEEEAAALKDGVAGVGLDGGPDGEGAVVDDSQDGLWMLSGVGNGGEDQECGGEDQESGGGEEWE
ncbi:hypothetical protein DVH24_032826 [Malus domestica]|uniref:Uncharacterized protein n=1 Tax=Malus domestica TaxID=3750 RepID=A0A498IRL7_MALDO|nr:hypothetical protein DVH24_032826 [Malus domestica]